MTRVVVDLFRIGYKSERKWRQLMNKNVRKSHSKMNTMDKLKRKYQAIQKMG